MAEFDIWTWIQGAGGAGVFGAGFMFVKWAWGRVSERSSSQWANADKIKGGWKEQAEQFEKRAKEYEEKYENLRKEKDTVIESLRDSKHSAENEAHTKAELNRELRRTNDKLEEEISDLKSSHRSEIERIESEYELKINKITSEYDIALDRLKSNQQAVLEEADEARSGVRIAKEVANDMARKAAMWEKAYKRKSDDGDEFGTLLSEVSEVSIDERLAKSLSSIKSPKRRAARDILHTPLIHKIQKQSLEDSEGEDDEKGS